ncbi:BgtAc-30043 [Blumeria graminis f. sp. tritici]|uniref:BgtAc-30043 n=2 Tax=Blumeria graminis f. sp. tritici TaxID=62690 RepID=A0A9X9MP94_BLUGR|nr:hypothetical protein BGT96224_Ac30043 [Blumeria graminis f. sp. tritici 96224]VDB94901.1 BgtAc-30043 [Blumeria graminis f. sp. tritici]
MEHYDVSLQLSNAFAASGRRRFVKRNQGSLLNGQQQGGLPPGPDKDYQKLCQKNEALMSYAFADPEQLDPGTPKMDPRYEMSSKHMISQPETPSISR